MNSEHLSRKASLCLPFSSADTATLACKVLSVDKELTGSGVTRQITTEGSNLLVNFNGTDIKKLRVAVNAFLRNITLIVKTVEQFQS